MKIKLLSIFGLLTLGLAFYSCHDEPEIETIETEPRDTISELELAGEGYKVLALIEEQKAMPWQAVYDEFCLRNNVPVGDGFIAEIEQYEKAVTSKR